MPGNEKKLAHKVLNEKKDSLKRTSNGFWNVRKGEIWMERRLERRPSRE